MKISNKLDRAVAGEVFTTGYCNMDCSYCYIPKNDYMKEIHENIIEDLKEDKFIKRLGEVYGDNLKNLSLWGTEPTLTLELITDRLDKIADEFPNLETFSFSTNLWNFRGKLIDLLNHADNIFDSGITLDIQISLDGPKDITDKNRREGATDKIRENFRELIIETNSINLENVRLELGFKPTLGKEDIKRYKYVDKLIDFFKFFDELIKFYKDNSNNDRVILKGSGNPTIVVPNTYSAEDGKNFKSFIKSLNEINEMNKEEDLFNCITGHVNTYYHRFNKLLKYYDDIPRNLKMFTCSGGDSQYAVDTQDNVHICHRTLFLKYDKYFNEVEEDDHNNIRNYIVDKEDDYELTRFLYTMRNYHDFIKFRVNYTSVIVRELAYSGQANKKYLENEDFLKMFCYFINTAYSCPVENLLRTGSVHLLPISIIRVFANGAFEEIYKDAIN